MLLFTKLGMNNLGLDYHGDDIIQLKNVSLPKGKLVQVQALKTSRKSMVININS